MNYDVFFKDAIQSIKAEGRYRYFTDLKRKVGHFPRAEHFKSTLNSSGKMTENSDEVTVWCSNDYLGMGQNLTVISTMHRAIDECGAGAGGTRNISGTNHYHTLLEKEIADLHQKPSALLFNSGYMSNWATLTTLASHLPNCVVLSDANNHASMIEGIRHAKCEKVIFKHNDVEDLKKCLQKYDINRPKIVAFESIYSMDGDIAPIEAFAKLCREYNAISYLDEVHAVGMYGEHGGGISEVRNITDQIDIIEGTLGKAFGLIGGYITGSESLIDFVRSNASGFIFTTSLPPAIAAAAITSIQYLKNSSIEREGQQKNVRLLKMALTLKGIPFIDNPGHIVPILVKQASLCKQLSDELLELYQVYIQPINYPTVPKGTERLRITPTPLHSKAQLDYLVASIDELWDKHSLPREVTPPYIASKV